MSCLVAHLLLLKLDLHMLVKSILLSLSICIDEYISAYACPCICIWLLHPARTNAQDGLDLLQLALVALFPIIN